MRRATHTIASALALLVLAACGNESAEQMSEPSTSSSVPDATTSSVPDACAGLADCTVLAEADVDGDGKSDTVALVGSNIDVVTAAGPRTQTRTGGPQRPTDPALQQRAGFVGAFDVDGRRGAEFVVEDESMGGTSRYRVWTWADGHLTAVFPPTPLGSGPLAQWVIARGEGRDVAVRCTDDATRPIEVWASAGAYGSSGPAQSTMTVTAYASGNGAGSGDDSPFTEIGAYNADPQDLGSLPGAPWLCGTHATASAAEAVVQCGTDSKDTAIAAGLGRLPANPARGADWVFGGESNFDPCADLSYAVADTAHGTGSSPMHLMFFHRGEYVGTATSCALAMTTVTASAQDSVDVRYRYPRGMESNAGATGVATTTYAWNGNSVVMNAGLPEELLAVNGC